MTDRDRGVRAQVVHVAHPPDVAAGEEDPLERYVPPFELVADMLFVLTTIPREGLERSFVPPARFAGALGRTPARVWFSRVHSIEHGPAHDRRRGDASPASATTN